MSAVLDVVVEVTKDGSIEIDKIKRSANEAEKATKNFTGSTDMLSGSISNMVKNLAITVGSMYAVKQAFDFGASFVNTSAQFEQFETTLTSITGSSEEASKSMDWIKDFTAKTPFELDKVTDAFVKMKAYGLNPTDGTLKTLGDTASAMGKDIGQAVEAMADAVTGENERLKEFGVKASQSGGKVAYAWSDSSGKARNIVIDNNKDIIQSTLNAIFNEKYVGAMDAQSKTWNGMMSNLSDKWTLFKQDIMSEGLFTYLKGILSVVGDRLGGAFGNAKSGAKAFSDSVIGGIKSIILGVGNMTDLWSGVKLAFSAVEVAFTGVTFTILNGVNMVAKGWELLWVGAKNIFKSVVDSVGEGFANMANFVIEKINSIIDALTGLGSDALEFLGFKGIEKVSIPLLEYNSVLQETKASTDDLINTDWSKNTAGKALADMDSLTKSIINEDGKQTALKMIGDIDKKVSELNVKEVQGNKTKDDAKKLLDEMGAGYGTVGESADKSGKKSAKALKDSENALKKATKEADNLNRKFLELSGDKEGLFILDVDAQLKELMNSGKYTAEQIGKAYDGMYKDYVDSGKDANKEIALDFTQQFEGLFDGLISGDLGSALKGMFSGISMEMSKGLVKSMSDSISSGIGSLVGGLGELGGGLVGLGIGLLGSLFGGDEEQTPPVLDDMAKTSESMANALDSIKDAQYPMLALTREMTGYLQAISNAFSGAENSLLRSGLDLGGSTYKGTSKAGFLGLTGKSTELFGTSVNIASTSISSMMNGYVSATLDTVTKTVKKGIFKTKTSYNTVATDISNQLGQYLAEATQSAFNSLTLSGSALGISTAGLANQTISIGKFDTTGMSAGEVASEIEARFSAGMDAIAEQYFGAVREFQKGGEGLAETLYRVTVTFEQVGHSLGLINKSVNWRTANIIADVAGGIDALNSSLSSYTENFFSDKEKYDMMATTMSKNFESLGLSMPSTNAEFRGLIESINTTTDEGARLFGEVITLAGGFSEMTSALDALNGAEADRLKALEEAREAEIKAKEAEAKALYEAQLGATRKYVNDISSFLTGQYSFLTSQGKTDYANMMLDKAKTDGQLIDVVEISRLRVEQAYKTASTREEFDVISREHLNTLVDNAKKDATNSDLLSELVGIRQKIAELEETTRLKP